MEINFFDANCSIGKVARPTPETITDVEQLLIEMEHINIKEALVCHNQAIERAIDTGNRKLLKLIKDHPQLHPAWMFPMHTSIDYPQPEKIVTEMLDLGVKSVRIEPSPYNGYLVEEWALGPLWKIFDLHKVPVMLVGSDLSRYPDQPAKGFSAQNVYDICKKYPNIPFTLLRINFSATRVLLPLLKECPNLHVEVSYFTAHRGVEYLTQNIGAERIIFGSGLPWGPPGPGKVAVNYAAISDEERRLIAGDNLRRLLNEVS